MNLLAILAVISVTGVYARNDGTIEDHVKRKCEMDSPVKLSYFKVEDKVNIWCCDCPVGYFMDAACNNINSPFPICKQCEYSDNKQTFMDKINHSNDCYVSRKSCDDVMNTWLKHGNSKEDNTCECNDGYYRETDEGYCKKHTSCSKGFGVTKLGTKSSDTDCVKCVGNKFSDVESSTEECKPHSKCKSGQKLVFGGNSSSDVTCLDVVLPSPDSNSSTPTESITTAVEDQVATEVTTFPIPIKRESSISLTGIVIIIIIIVAILVIGIGCCCKKYCRNNNASTERSVRYNAHESAGDPRVINPSNHEGGNSQERDDAIEDKDEQGMTVREGVQLTNGSGEEEINAHESAGDPNSDPRVNNPLLPPDHEGGNSQEGDDAIQDADEQGMEPSDEEHDSDAALLNESEDTDSSEGVQLTNGSGEEEINAHESAGDPNSDPRVNNPLLPPDHEGDDAVQDTDEQGMEPADEEDDSDAALLNESEDIDSSEEFQLTNGSGEEDIREDPSVDNKAEREIAGDDREIICIGFNENVLENDMCLNNPELFPEHFHEEISAYDQGRVDEVLQSHETGEAMLCGEHGLYNEIRTEDLKKFIRDKNLLRHLQIEDLEQENKEKQEMRSKMMICVAQNLGRKLTPKYLFELAVKYEPQYIYDTMYKVFTSTLNQQPH